MVILLPENPPYSGKLRVFLEPLVPDGTVWLERAEQLRLLQNEKILFAVALDEGGCGFEYYRMLSRLRRTAGMLDGCTGGVVVTGEGELYTKDVARDLVLAANLAGCAFLGRPLVEATGSLRNFQVQAEIHGTDEASAFRLAAEELIDRLLYWPPPPPVKKLVALHASSRATSNTLALWEFVRRGLPEAIEVQELCLLNGTVADCNGCTYTTCLHFGEQGGCFYGGPMVDEVFPAVRGCDALVMLCANYNDVCEPSDSALPAEPLLRQAAVRSDRLRLFGRRPVGAPADFQSEHEQKLLPAAPFLSDGDGQREGEPCQAPRRCRARRCFCAGNFKIESRLPAAFLHFSAI